MGPFLSYTVVFVITILQFIWRCLPKLSQGYSLSGTGAMTSKCAPVIYIWDHQLCYYVEVLCYKYEGLCILRISINHMHYTKRRCVRSSCEGPFHYPMRRLIVRSRKICKPRDLPLKLHDRSEIWQAPQQQWCRCACQFSKRCDNLNYQSQGFENSRDLTIRRLIWYWNRAFGHFLCGSSCQRCAHVVLCW